MSFGGSVLGGVSFTNYKGFSCRQAPNPHIKKGLKKGMEPGEQKTPLSFTVKKANACPKSSENKSKLQEHEQGFSCRRAAEPWIEKGLEKGVGPGGQKNDRCRLLISYGKFLN